MRLSLKDLRGRRGGETGAATVDWMALAAAVVVIGVGLGYAIFGPSEDGAGGLAGNEGAELTETAGAGD